RYAMSLAPSPAHAGDTIQVRTTTTLHRPGGGTLVFYVVPASGSVLSPVEFARKTVTVTSAGRVNDVDQRNFRFAPPYDAPGEYIFMAGDLGDTAHGAK